MDTGAALRYVRTNVFTNARTGVSRIAIIITNGNSINVMLTQEEADLTRRAGISIMAIAVGNWLNIHELMGLVSYPGNMNTLRVDNYETLGNVSRTCRNSICGSEYTSIITLL